MCPDKYNVLVVDDSPIVVKRILQILNELECISSIENASSFTEATILLDKQKFDIALLDINLPGKNGIELLSFIKTNYPATKIIMLSNQSDSYYRSLCQRLGSDSFIDKTSEFENIPHNIMGYYNDFITGARL